MMHWLEVHDYAPAKITIHVLNNRIINNKNSERTVCFASLYLPQNKNVKNAIVTNLEFNLDLIRV